MIALIDINISNINSVSKALDHLGVDYKVVNNPDEVAECEGIIFPGVGSFNIASEKLKLSGMREVIKDNVINQQMPFLGICLGMQLVANTSLEGGESKGLGLIDAEVMRIPEDHRHKVPHVGWNNVAHDGAGVFAGIEPDADFYFVHSYRMVVNDSSVKCFYTDYVGKTIAYVESGNIYGAQFHPEKSQFNGLKLLKNFSGLC